MKFLTYYFKNVRTCLRRFSEPAPNSGFILFLCDELLLGNYIERDIFSWKKEKLRQQLGKKKIFEGAKNLFLTLE